MNKIDKFLNIFLILAGEEQDTEITINTFAKDNNLELEEVFKFLCDYLVSGGKLKNLLSLDIIYKMDDKDLNVDIINEKLIEYNCSILDELEKKEFYEALISSRNSINKIISELPNSIKEEINAINEETKKGINKRSRKEKIREIENIKKEFKNGCIEDVANEIESFLIYTKELYNYPLLIEDALKNKEIFENMYIVINDNYIGKEKINLVKEGVLNLREEEKIEIFRFLRKNKIEIDDFKEVEASLNNKINLINNSEIIKRANTNFCKWKELLEEIVKLINEGAYVDIVLKSKKNIKNVKITKIIYDKYSYTWKLKYEYKGSILLLLLSNIEKIQVSQVQKCNRKKINIRTKKEKVKFRVFNEFNAKEKAIRFAINYNLKLDHKKEYIDFTIEIEDVNRVLRFARSLVPSVVILEPKELKESFKKEILQWENKYS
ncbi:WYL domain-containing protein [Clostridium perfringens]|nr:WYL domain-containing protein [Clostridium perfringens]